MLKFLKLTCLSSVFALPAFCAEENGLEKEGTKTIATFEKIEDANGCQKHVGTSPLVIEEEHKGNSSISSSASGDFNYGVEIDVKPTLPQTGKCKREKFQDALVEIINDCKSTLRKVTDLLRLTTPVEAGEDKASSSNSDYIESDSDHSHEDGGLPGESPGILPPLPASTEFPNGSSQNTNVPDIMGPSSTNTTEEKKDNSDSLPLVPPAPFGENISQNILENNSGGVLEESNTATELSPQTYLDPAATDIVPAPVNENNAPSLSPTLPLSDAPGGGDVASINVATEIKPPLEVFKEPEYFPPQAPVYLPEINASSNLVEGVVNPVESPVLTEGQINPVQPSSPIIPFSEDIKDEIHTIVHSHNLPVEEESALEKEIIEAINEKLNEAK